MTLHPTVGQELIRLLEAQGVDTVFGIPGVHTVELYRGLARSAIRHVTPRQEQDAGFMADGYARASGKPGVCLLITGPGVTNAITAMGQARADSIPMLVISGVNALSTLGRYEGHLHELPDQRAMMATIALSSERLEKANDLAGVLSRAFSAMRTGRPGPVHIEIPIDLMEALVTERQVTDVSSIRAPDAGSIAKAAELCNAAKRPTILAGGGAVWADAEIRALAERLDAPVVTTTNARGILAGHPLGVQACPSLPSVRSIVSDADLVIAIGTQFGPTDYDVYVDGGFIAPANLIRIDVDPQASDSIPAEVAIVADARLAVEALNRQLADVRKAASGAARATVGREGALAELSPKMQALTEVVHAVRDAVPGCVMVGDSTQLVYAGNLYCEVAAPRSWFNASVGFGSLGYGPPAAVGASLALGDVPVVCLVGDGGFQFCLGALGTALDERAPVIFLVWNNHGYQEIEDFMVSRDIEPIGVRPSAPDFVKLAQAYGIQAERIRLTDGENQAALVPGKLDLSRLAGPLLRARKTGGPALIEIETP